MKAGDAALELRGGTAALAALLVERGAEVVGIDVSDATLTIDRTNVPNAELVHMTATEIDALGEERFDRTVATLSPSELSANELDHALALVSLALQPGATVVIADEVRLQERWQRALATRVRWPPAALTFVLTRSGTPELDGLEPGLARIGPRMPHQESCLLGTPAPVIAGREK